MIKPVTEVIKCVVLSDDSYKVSHKCSKDSTVNLATNIVHVVHLYTIPTCDCGNWMFYFIMCPCIIQSMTIAGRDVENMKNLHPLHLTEIHPVWKLAFKESKLEG